MTPAQKKAEAFKREMAAIFEKYYDTHAEGIDFDIDSFDEHEDEPYYIPYYIVVSLGRFC